MVQETIDLRGLDRHEYALLPSLDSELQRIEDELLATRDQLDAEHERVGKELGVEIDKKLHLENHQVHKYSFRITKAASLSSQLGRKPELTPLRKPASSATRTKRKAITSSRLKSRAPSLPRPPCAA